ncbi:MAG: FeoB-associated Cys-rich membrane protein [Mitsuokella sp.]
MATFVVGVVLVIALFFALRHIYRNFCAGREDCCGGSCRSCSGHCSSCRSFTAPIKK